MTAKTFLRWLKQTGTTVSLHYTARGWVMRVAPRGGEPQMFETHSIAMCLLYLSFLAEKKKAA